MSLTIHYYVLPYNPLNPIAFKSVVLFSKIAYN